MSIQTKASRLAMKLVDDFNILQTGDDNGENWEAAQKCALFCVKNMMVMFKKGFNVTNPDHTPINTEEYQLLERLPKEIKSYTPC